MAVESMHINWKPNEKTFKAMESLFISLGKDALHMNHYDFAAAFPNSSYNTQDWKEFLTDNRVIEYINSEFEAIKQTELRKIIIDIGDSRSVGQAQIINSLQKLMDGKDLKKEGPAYIYAYVPLDAEQMHADNVEVLDEDPFITTETLSVRRHRKDSRQI